MKHAAALRARIQDILAAKERALIAIDGMAASGKTTQYLLYNGYG